MNGTAAVDVGGFGQFPQAGDLGHAHAAGLFQRKRNPAFDESFADRRHFRVPAECESEVYLRFPGEQLLARIIERATESRGDLLALGMLGVGDRDDLDAGRLKRIEIERNMPMARLQQCNSHRCAPLRPKDSRLVRP